MTASISSPTPGQQARPWNTSTFDLAAAGYEEVEVFLAGEVRGRATADGADSGQPYKTRMIIRRPADASRFTGRVLVEWMNVSAGRDVDVSWPAVWPMIVREGWAFVGVCAQPVGLEHARAWDPARYGSLVHPGTPEGEMPAFVRDETFSDAIFTEAAQALAGPDGVELLGAAPELLLAHGQSQSSMRLAAYLTTEHVRAPVFGGYLLHAGGSARLVDGAIVRTPLALPDDATVVLHVNSEAEATGAFGDNLVDDPRYRYWEVAGSGHTPATTSREVRARGESDRPTPSIPFGPPTIEYALRAALVALDTWIGGGDAPAAPPLVETTVDAEGTKTVVTDEHGNAKGGLRLPHIEVPLGRFYARHPEPGLDLAAGYVAFDDATLRALYGNPDQYRERVEAASKEAVAAGVLLSDDAVLVAADAAAVTF